MKKSLLFAFCMLLVIITPRQADAQTVFAPLGAEWWYTHHLPFNAGGLLRAFADSTVTWQGQTCQRIRTQYYVYLGNGTYQPSAFSQGTFYTYTQGNRVYYLQGNQARLLFDLDWAVNTAWAQGASCVGDTAGTVSVDSAGALTYSGQSLRFVRLRAESNHPVPGNMTFSAYGGTVIERVGYPGCAMVPQAYCGLDPEYYDLLGYFDSTVAFGIRPTIVLSTAEQLTQHSVLISPNPSNDGRYQMASVGKVRYDVIDARGRHVCSGQLAGASTTIDLSEQPAGLYVLRLIDAVGRGISRRLVRE